jgi:hypothetical protein
VGYDTSSIRVDITTIRDRLLYVAGLPSAGFEVPDDVFGPFLAESVGGAKANLITNRDTVIHAAEEKMGPADWGLEVRKIDEAFALAQHLGMGFCEATEIYSGMEGNLN